MSTGHESPPTLPRRSGRALLRPGVFLAGLLLLCAAVLAGARFLLPEVRHFRAELEEWVGRTIGQRVEIGTIDAWWRGWTPMLRIGDVRFVTGENAAGAGATVAADGAPASGGETATGAETHPPAQLADLTFSIDLPESLRARALRLRGIVAGGASFAVVRRAGGAFSVAGLGEPSSPGSRAGERFARWALGQESASLRSSRILWIDEQRRIIVYQQKMAIPTNCILQSLSGLPFSIIPKEQ